MGFRILRSTSIWSPEGTLFCVAARPYKLHPVEGSSFEKDPGADPLKLG